MLQNGADVFAQDADRGLVSRGLSVPLMVAALLLFLADIALRRFPSAANALERRFGQLKKPKAKKAGKETAVSETAGEKRRADVPKQAEPPAQEKAAPETAGTAQRLVAAKKNRRK